MKAAEQEKGRTTLHAKGDGGAEGQEEAGNKGLMLMDNVVARRRDEGQEGQLLMLLMLDMVLMSRMMMTWSVHLLPPSDHSCHHEWLQG